MFLMRPIFSPLISELSFWAVGFFMCGAALVLNYFSPLFSYDYLVVEMPIVPLVIGMVLVGLVFVYLRVVLPAVCQKNRSVLFHFGRVGVSALFGIFALGLIARLLLIMSEPVLEDDYQRYLWDGGVLASGVSPYRYSPQQVLDGRVPRRLHELSLQSLPITDRINHPELRTIYPIGAEAFFALAHKGAPWSLPGWRGVILIAEVVSFIVLTLILKQLGRSFYWVSLYWWNPLVIKELINSAHMEGVLVPFILGGLYFCLRGAYVRSGALFSLAASIKLWPALLLPIVWWQLTKRPLWLVISFFIALLTGVLIIYPFVVSGLNESSGLVAYGLNWKTNSAFYPAFEGIVTFFTSLLGGGSLLSAMIARGMIGCFLIVMVLWLTVRPASDQRQVVHRLVFIAFAVFLFSPAQFPWYFVWIAPLLAIYPLWGFLVLVPLMALYYLGFYLFVQDLHPAYSGLMAWIVWLPVWLLLVVESAITITGQKYRRSVCAAYRLVMTGDIWRRSDAQ